MKRFLLVILFFTGAVSYYYMGLYLGDLAHIGGYDGVAPEWLCLQFQYGDNPVFLLRSVDIAALSCLLLGPIGTLAAALYGLYQLAAGARALLAKRKPGACTNQERS